MRRLVSAGLLVVALAGCRLEIHVGVDVESDGSGEVRVAVALDDDAVRRAGGNLDERIEVDDLVATGWVVTGPEKEDDGRTWIRASKPFATPDEAAAVMAEINGPAGPFRDFVVSRKRSFARTQWIFTGTVDFRRGLEAFSDEQLTAALEGHPLGESVEEIEQRLGQTLDRLVGIEVTVRLPGSIRSNAPLEASNGASWQPGLRDDEPLELRATGSERNMAALAWAGLAVVAMVLLVVWVLTTLARHGAGRRGSPEAVTPPT